VIETNLGRLDVGLQTQLDTISQSLQALALELINPDDLAAALPPPPSDGGSHTS